MTKREGDKICLQIPGCCKQAGKRPSQHTTKATRTCWAGGSGRAGGLPAGGGPEGARPAPLSRDAPQVCTAEMELGASHARVRLPGRLPLGCLGLTSGCAHRVAWTPSQNPRPGAPSGTEPGCGGEVERPQFRLQASATWPSRASIPPNECPSWNLRAHRHRPPRARLYSAWHLVAFSQAASISTQGTTECLQWRCWGQEKREQKRGPCL